MSDNVNNASTASASYTVGFAVCPQYDATRVKHAGSVVPIRIQLCDATGANLSAAGIVVTATGLSRVGSTVTGVVDDAGNANPDNDFRFDPTSRSYVFNLSTTGLIGGTWALNFTIAGDAIAHSAPFQIQ